MENSPLECPAEDPMEDPIEDSGTCALILWCPLVSNDNEHVSANKSYPGGYQ